MSSRSADRLVIDVFELARTGGVVDGRLPLASFERLQPSLAAAGGELVYRYDASVDTEGRPAGRLSLAGAVPLVCDRCSGPVQWPIDVLASYYFVRTDAELARIPVDETDEEPLVGSARFNLRALIEDELILALPISPRHDDCRAPAVPGQPSAVAVDPRPSPFAALAGLKPRRH